jgi:hypothetical protein
MMLTSFCNLSKKSVLGLLAFLFTQSLFAAPKEWHYIQEGAANGDGKVVVDISSTGEDGKYDVTYLSSTFNPKKQMLSNVRTHIGYGISCWETIYADGSNPALNGVSCENPLASDTFLEFNVYPNTDKPGNFRVESEVLNNGLGSVVYQKIGNDFTPAALAR